ncbi:MAG: thymidine phosphorylase, partial [Planctomycetota bacterium]|nr:thymidine phosphorylase [Planctomycetota bacterium]
LESISGFRTDLSSEEIRQQIDTVGCVITGASPQIAPADRKLYALRDVTATVESIPLITASILSKKLAAGLEALILDVKVGSGAFMKTMEQATELANSLVRVGNQLGMKTTALVTDMNQVLGSSTGNAIEIAEAIRMLEGSAPKDLEHITVELGAYLLNMIHDAGLEVHRKQLLATISDGSALEKFNAMIAGQGGLTFNYEIAGSFSIEANQSGFLAAMDASKIGFAIIELGGGRKKMGDQLDLGVGVEQRFRVGDEISKGDAVFRIVSNGPFKPREFPQAIKLLQDSFTIVERQPETTELIRKVITP